MISLTKAFKKLVYSDSWENAVTALGTAYASLSHHRMSLNVWLTEAELDELYVGDALARRIILQPILAAFKKGFMLVPPGEDMDEETAKEQEERIWLKLEELKAINKLVKAIAWGRLYGRGALLLGASDSRIDPVQELVEENVKKLKWVRDLVSEDFASATLDEDLESPDYGEPITWSVVKPGGSQVETHSSRMCITGAVPTSRRMRQEHDWRDIPVLQAVYQDLRNYDSAKTGMAQMLVDASQAVLKILNLPGVLADDSTVLKDRLRILEMARALHIMPINAGDMSGNGEETFEYVERTFSGVGDTFDRLLGALASAVGWPQTYLFGRSPAGENATGESDREIWDDYVLAIQEGDCLPPLQKLVDLIVAAEGLTEGWEVRFPPLRQMNELEKAQHGKTIAETDHIYIQDGVLSEDDISLWRFSATEPNFEPVSLSQERVEALQKLQEMDIERSTEEPEEPPQAPPMLPNPQEGNNDPGQENEDTEE